MAPKTSRSGSAELDRGFSAASSSGAEANIMNFKVNAFGIYTKNFVLAAPATVQDLIDAIFANPRKFSTNERGIIIMTTNSLELSESHEFSKPGLHLLNMRLKAKDPKTVNQPRLKQRRRRRAKPRRLRSPLTAMTKTPSVCHGTRIQSLLWSMTPLSTRGVHLRILPRLTMLIVME